MIVECWEVVGWDESFTSSLLYLLTKLSVDQNNLSFTSSLFCPPKKWDAAQNNPSVVITDHSLITIQYPHRIIKDTILFVNATRKNYVIVCRVRQDFLGSCYGLKAGDEIIGHPGDSSMQVYNNFLNHTKHHLLTFKVRSSNELAEWVQRSIENFTAGLECK